MTARQAAVHLIHRKRLMMEQIKIDLSQCQRLQALRLTQPPLQRVQFIHRKRLTIDVNA